MKSHAQNLTEEAHASIMRYRSVAQHRYDEFYQIVKLWPSVPLTELPEMLHKIDVHSMKWLGLTKTETSYREFIADRLVTDDHGKVYSFAGVK
jgi:hypothetical protein